MKALDYFDDAAAARRYVTRRAADAAKVVCLLSWGEEPCVNGVLRATIYGHRIWWDVTGGAYDVLPHGANEYKEGNLQQVLAFILAQNRRVKMTKPLAHTGYDDKSWPVFTEEAGLNPQG